MKSLFILIIIFNQNLFENNWNKISKNNESVDIKSTILNREINALDISEYYIDKELIIFSGDYFISKNINFSFEFHFNDSGLTACHFREVERAKNWLQLKYEEKSFLRSDKQIIYFFENDYLISKNIIEKKFNDTIINKIESVNKSIRNLVRNDEKFRLILHSFSACNLVGYNSLKRDLKIKSDTTITYLLKDKKYDLSIDNHSSLSDVEIILRDGFQNIIYKGLLSKFKNVKLNEKDIYITFLPIKEKIFFLRLKFKTISN